MHDPTFVGKLHHLGNLPHQIEPGGERQVAITGGQKVVQTHRGRIVLEDDRGPEFVLRELHRLQDAVVLQVFEKLKLTQRRPLAELPLVFRPSGLHRIDANPAFRFGQGDVLRLPVLEARALVDLVFEDVVADSPLFVGVPYAGLVDRPGHGLGRWAVQRRPAGEWLNAHALPLTDRGDDSRPGDDHAAVRCARFIAVTHADP